MQQLAEDGRERGPQLRRKALHDGAAGRAAAGRRQEVHDAAAQLPRGRELRKRWGFEGLRLGFGPLKRSAMMSRARHARPLTRACKAA